MQPYVAPVQTDILDLLDAPPEVPTASITAKDIEVEHLAAHPAKAAPEAVAEVPAAIQDENDDGLSHADHAVRAAPRDASGLFLPRPVPTISLPLIAKIAKLGQALYGQRWIGRVASDVGQHERQMRRWAEWEGRPPAVVYTRLRAAAERQIARIRDALNPAGGSPPTGAEASKAADTPHVGDRQAVAQALAIHVELRKAALVEKAQAARKGPPIDEG